jgi:thioredoxin 1
MKVIRFTASWCQPCKMLAKNLEEIKTNIPIEIVDIDENQDAAIEYGVRGVPTLLKIDENNNVIAKQVGMTSLKQLQEWFDND